MRMAYLENLGLGFDQLERIKPGLVLLSSNYRIWQIWSGLQLHFLGPNRDAVRLILAVRLCSPPVYHSVCLISTPSPRSTACLP